MPKQKDGKIWGTAFEMPLAADKALPREELLAIVKKYYFEKKYRRFPVIFEKNTNSFKNRTRWGGKNPCTMK
ncbi:hypothetical protein FACS189479_06210 [Spirochaetia bacterium]|nr:hypothetical protein FACS189479_06210 [Spirochaetia bacterium]